MFNKKKIKDYSIIKKNLINFIEVAEKQEVKEKLEARYKEILELEKNGK